MRCLIQHHQVKKVAKHQNEILALVGHLKRCEAVQVVDCHRWQPRMAYALQIAAVSATYPSDLDSPVVGIATW